MCIDGVLEDSGTLQWFNRKKTLLVPTPATSSRGFLWLNMNASPLNSAHASKARLSLSTSPMNDRWLLTSCIGITDQLCRQVLIEFS